MAETLKKEKKTKVDKVSKEGKKEEKMQKAKKQAAATAFSLLADDKAVDPALSSLFSRPAPAPIVPQPAPVVSESDDGAEVADVAGVESDEPAEDVDVIAPEAVELPHDDRAARRKRKRKDADEDLEDAYMQKLAREEDKDAALAAAERASKRQKVKPLRQNGEDSDADADQADPEADGLDGDEMLSDDVDVEDNDDAKDDDVATPPPKHETQEAADVELSKANRTVFLGNVSTTAISSKTARKALVTHLGSFFAEIAEPKKDDPKHKLESLRFRSTPYAVALPKKAAYARKELMDATAKSTNAYVVYSSSTLAREAAKRLNGTVVLDRHLRVDEIAHPAKVDNKRCVFVGNLGFVDDETNIQDANEEDGREKRKRGKEPADVEEGLWRTFNKCGTVESVRVIRDSTTRVGKGIAYVQFEDENGVEAALLYNEKKFPPMLPRKLRVTRARAQKKNAKPGSGRPSSRPHVANTGYQRKITGAEASQMGRAGKLYGRAAASKMKQPRRAEGTTGPQKSGPNAAPLGNGIKAPETFIFEGHRASSKSGKSGLKLGGKKGGGGGGKGKPTNRSAKRGAAYKAGGSKKKTS
ncbi:hypothetical protein LTR36_008862 [Oleoguttula mirabilis]|uniref:Nucleolar protein 12 n=1 Tax=Oleoguttula mirabilis TaxID=1507867 RepID=A0AAV9J738_9PEZI|nr:hypothetical protein LTR36_008862 [Oleoguttula mirabilis]